MVSSMSSGLGVRKRTKFCALCGKETEELINGLCIECYRKTYPLIPRNAPSQLEVKICKYCGAFTLGHVWRKTRVEDINKAVEIAVEMNIRRQYRSKNYHIVNLEISRMRYFEGKYVVNVKLRVRGEGGESHLTFEEEKTVSVHVVFSTCPECKDVISKAERAIIQVRAGERRLTESEVAEIRRIVNKEAEKLFESDRGAFPFESSETVAGIDYKFTSAKAARRIAQAISRRFSAKLLETHKDVGGTTSNGRTKTKVTYRVLLPSFRSGDVVRLGKHLYYILSIEKGKVTAIALPSLKETKISLSSFRSAELVVKYEESTPVMVISTSGAIVQLMNMEDYQTFELSFRKIPLWIEPGKIFRLFKVNNEFFVLPTQGHRKT